MPIALIDTNILIYAHDRSEPVKQAQSIALLRHLQQSDEGRLGVQNLSEFFAATTRGRQSILTVQDAAHQVELLTRAWRILNPTGFVVLEAVRGVQVHGMAFWDAQIWALARLNQISIILSEDFSSGSVIEGVRFVNPFAPDFDRDRWFPAR